MTEVSLLSCSCNIFLTEAKLLTEVSFKRQNYLFTYRSCLVFEAQTVVSFLDIVDDRSVTFPFFLIKLFILKIWEPWGFYLNHDIFSK